MKKLIALSLFMMVLLAACGNKLDGTYEGKNDGMDTQLKLDTKSDKATLSMTFNESGVKANVSFDGTIDQENEHIVFDIDGEKHETSYTVKGDKLILEAPKGEEGDLEFTKVD